MKKIIYIITMALGFFGMVYGFKNFIFIGNIKCQVSNMFYVIIPFTIMGLSLFELLRIYKNKSEDKNDNLGIIETLIRLIIPSIALSLGLAIIYPLIIGIICKIFN